MIQGIYAEGFLYPIEFQFSSNLEDGMPIGNIMLHEKVTHPTSGIKTDVQVTDTFPLAIKSGLIAVGLKDHFYNTILVIPSPIYLGNLVSSQIRDCEVWNTNFEPKTCTGFIQENAEGISLMQGNQNPSFVIESLKSELYHINISISGPPIIDAKITWVFDFEEVILKITGARVVIFPFVPNGAVQEEIEWFSDVIESYSGEEKRLALRYFPRHKWGFSVSVDNQRSRNWMKNFLLGWQQRIFSIPSWHEATRISSAVIEGAMNLNFNTSFAGYEEGGMVFIYEDDFKNEALEIDSINSTSISFLREVQNTYSPGAIVCPLKQARLPISVPLQETKNTTSVDLEWSIQDIVELPYFNFPFQYQGLDVITDPSFVASVPLQREIYQPVDKIDYGTGIREYNSRLNYSSLDSPGLSFNLDSKEDIWNFRCWMHKLKGKQKPFWLPSFTQDITFLQYFGEDQVSFEIENIGYGRFLHFDPLRKYLFFIHKEQGILFREIVNFGQLGNNEFIQLDAPFGFIGSMNDFVLISFMSKVRLNSDRIELVFDKIDKGKVSIPIKGVKQ